MLNSNLYKKYNTQIKAELVKELSLKSVMQVPKLEKIVINMGLGEVTTDKAKISNLISELSAIAGQSAVANRAKTSNASFKLRKGMVVGSKVTLRGKKMYDFLEKLIMVSLPRIRDFRGLSPNAFDGRGNYTIGIKEYIIFPEIDLDKVKQMKGADISIITTAKNDQTGYLLLKKLGLPFREKK